jgi:hypothetical protein
MFYSTVHFKISTTIRSCSSIHDLEEVSTFQPDYGKNHSLSLSNLVLLYAGASMGIDAIQHKICRLQPSMSL